jgi:hypothetical protein
MSGRPWLVVVVFLAACDTRAQAPSTPSAEAAAPGDPDRASREHESCGATAHCAVPLRCLDQVCRSGDQSVLGDYHAARAQVLRDGGDLDAALATYETAYQHYKDEGKVVPAAIDCAYGNTLAGSPKQAELAARLLHRCIQGSPMGSDVYWKGLLRIASLDEAGFDPVHLKRPEQGERNQ